MANAVFFDVDGVLLDSISAKGEAFVVAFGDYPEHAEAIRKLHRENGGVSRELKIAMIREQVCGLPADATDAARRARAFAAVVVERVLAAPEIAGATAALADLGVDHPLHAVSATPDTELAGILERRGWARHFRSVHGTPPGKKETLRDLLDRHAYDRSACIMVGDSAQDRAAAAANGIPFILVTGSIDADPRDVDAIPDLVSLPRLVRERSRMGE